MADDNLAIPPAITITRQYLSHSHILAAAYFARQSARIEREHGSKGWIEVNKSGAFIQHRAYVMGAIFSAVAFLEATINELFLDTVAENDIDVGIASGELPWYHRGRKPRGPYTALPNALRSQMAQQWQQEVRKLKPLLRFQRALQVAGKDPYHKGRPPYQDVDLLMRLRNALIHYEVEWVQAGEHRIENALRGRFPLNPFFPEDLDNTFYPDKCLGHGCAKWAVHSSLEFADSFHDRLPVVC